MWVNVAFSTKKGAASRDAAPSKYQNNVSNTNYYNSFVKHPFLVASPTTYLMHLVVNLDNGLWNWPVLILTLYELELDTSISEWVLHLVAM